MLSHRVLLLSLAIAGCGVPEASAPDLSALPGSSLNGSSLNGSSLNGSSLNGSSLNSNDLNNTLASVSFVGAKHNGSSAIYDQVWLEGSQLKALKGATYDGEELEWAVFRGRTASGTSVRVMITDAIPPSEGDDRWRYKVSYRDAFFQWWPICEDAAYALSGTWSFAFGTSEGGSKTDDGTAFTFACTGTSALAKCVDLGYRPWAGLADHHQACVRLLRADYCGDGNSHTQDGTPVNLFDGRGIQKDTEDWSFEAEWDQHGARCFSPLNRSHAAIPCYMDRLVVGCGLQSFPLGTLLVNETQTNGISLEVIGGIDINLGLGL